METTTLSRRPIRATKVEQIGGWYTLEGGAAVLGVSRQTVYEGIRRYEVPVKEVGNTLLFRPGQYERARERARARKGARRWR